MARARSATRWRRRRAASATSSSATAPPKTRWRSGSSTTGIEPDVGAIAPARPYRYGSNRLPPLSDPSAEGKRHGQQTDCVSGSWPSDRPGRGRRSQYRQHAGRPWCCGTGPGNVRDGDRADPTRRGSADGAARRADQQARGDQPGVRHQIHRRRRCDDRQDVSRGQRQGHADLEAGVGWPVTTGDVMAELLQQGIGRVRGSATAPVAGSAFLISASHVMTCAHVVNVALGRAWNATERPDETARVQVEFPFARRGTGLSASVAEWRPPADGVATDIAVLVLERDVAERPYRTIAGLPHRGQAFWTKGFPAGQDGGMDAAGELGTPIEHGRLLAHGSALPGFFIEGGFSGAPLLDEASNAVIGMAAAAARDESKRTAFIIPADQLELAWPPLARPYKGLNAFREVDWRFFFGRTVFVDELASKLARLPFVAVVGRSGSGKSSLVRAGLLPRLHDEGMWRVLVVRPGAPSADPFRNLAVCLLDAVRGAGTGLGAILDEDAVAKLAIALRDDPTVLVDRLRRLAGDGPDARNLLLLVDQFEELFTLVADPHEDDERSVRVHFVQCLWAGVDTTHVRVPAARCVVTLRADYLGRALAIRALADILKDADIKLAPMKATELRAAIEEPARILGVRFDDGLVDELMQSVGGSHDALPLLEFTLADLWSKQRGRVILRPAQPAGDAAIDVLVTSLMRHADTVYDDLSRRFGEATFRTAMTALVWLGDPTREGEDTRRMRRRSEF